MATKTLYFNFLLLLVILYSCNNPEVTQFKKEKNNKSAGYLGHNDTVKYVGKEQCRMCHAEIYDSYIQTGMGRSLNYATKNDSVLSNKDIPVIYDEFKNFYYQPFFKNDSLYIKEFRLDNKDTVHKRIEKITYKIGSGHHTNSHLYEINGYIHQIPYTYYTQENISDLPPGYENGGNTRFSREIALECMSCHNGHSNLVEGSNHKYHSIPQGIECESCHGPGEVHVKRKLAGELIDTSKYIDYSIVNPSKLSLDKQFDVCQRCHLQGTSVLKEGKTFNSFKPGMSLKDHMDTYLPKYSNNHSFIMASHVDRLKQSSCFKSSEMTCITCHNPHKSVTSLKNQYFDNKCMSCHEICSDDQLENCSSCHMPESSTLDIMHVSITDHKIGFHNESEKFYDTSIFLGLHAINNPNPTTLSKAKAYLKRYESFEPESVYLDSALYYLERSKNNFSSFVQYYYLKNDFESLVNFSQNNKKINESKYSKSDLALAYCRIGDGYKNLTNNLSSDFINQSNYYYEKAIDLIPLVIEYRLKYASFLVNQNKTSEAFKQYEKVISLNPKIKQAHSSIALIGILNGEYDFAQKHLDIALDLDPDYVLAYENLVYLSQLLGDNNSAKLYSQKIIEINPKHRAIEIIKTF